MTAQRLTVIALFLIAALLVVIAVIISNGFAGVDSAMQRALCDLQHSGDTLARELCRAPLK